MSVPQPFPYQGSKRKIAPEIMAYLPDEMGTLIEPFAGSGAVTLRVAYTNKAQRFVLNDINAPLMALWQYIIDNPVGLAQDYEHLWRAQAGREKAFYFAIRDQFNQTPRPDYLLYLLARCVKAAVRYNANGEFNQSPDNRRKGMHPDRMRRNILHTAQLLKGKTRLSTQDYREVLAHAATSDVVYMDPPYQGVVSTQDPRYIQGLTFEHFVAALKALNQRGISYILSYDGRSGDKVYGKPLPPALKLTRIEINAGRSTQATLLGRSATTFEALYLSPALCTRLDTIVQPTQQLSLWT